MSLDHSITGMVNLVVALTDEAQPLVEHFSLQPAVGHDPFRVYLGKDLRLIISGIGKLAAATAAGYLYGWSGNRRDEAWLNVGIAGHAKLPLGTAILAHKVTDHSSSQRWYPPQILSTECLSCDLCCVDHPENEYGTNAAYDMESAGFIAAASRLATVELVQLTKIVSDNLQSSTDQISRQTIRDLVKQHVDLIGHLVSSLRDLSTEQITQAIPAPEFHHLCKRWHFTKTQTHQLRELLRRWKALRPADSILDVVENQVTSRSVIETLHNILNKTAMRIGDK